MISVFFYFLFIGGLMSSKADLKIVSYMTPDLFMKLHDEYGETLSCPCSTTTIPYKSFTTNEISFHSVCSSTFLNDQWIQAFYLPNRSYYYILDFRTTAYSQVRTDLRVDPYRFLFSSVQTSCRSLFHF